MSDINFQSSRSSTYLQAQAQSTSQVQSSIATTADKRSVSIADIKQKILNDIEQQLKNGLSSEDKKPLISAVIKDLEKTYLAEPNNNPKDPTAWEWNDWKDALYTEESKVTPGKKNYFITKTNQQKILIIAEILGKVLTKEQSCEITERLNKTEDNSHITPTDLESFKKHSSIKFMLFTIFNKFSQLNIPINKFIEAAIKQGFIEEAIINKIFSSVQKPSA